MAGPISGRRAGWLCFCLERYKCAAYQFKKNDRIIIYKMQNMQEKDAVYVRIKENQFFCAMVYL